MVGAGVAGLQNAPFGTLLRRPQRFNLTGEADGVARQYRLDPPQFTKTRRRSPDRNLLAARESVFRLALAIGHQQLHAHRPDMPARRRESAEQRFASLFLIEMKALRIELRGKFLDQVRGEGERPQFAPLPDLDILEETHQPACSATRLARRCTMIGETISHKTCPAALRTTPLNVTIPVSGRLRETLASVTSISSVRSSPGRSGASQRNSLTPGEPSDAVRPIKPSNIIRIMIEQRCQPEADRPFSIDRFAASSSRCIGWGSNSAAKASISSRVTRRGPNVAVFCGNLNPPTRMARALRASTALRCSCPILPGTTFGARPCAVSTGLDATH